MSFNEINILEKNEDELADLSKQMLLSLNKEEMLAIKKYFIKKGRNPTDVELETIAQTWSEHCKHKTFNADIEIFYEETGKSEVIRSIFKTYIVKATNKIARKKKGFLVSVFKDNAGIISFNKNYDVCFKVETHNHPSALEPYGGANTGLGGVIRDVLGAGLGAKPIANTDVFCFANPDYPYDKLPHGILHPKRIAKGVRAGVRDYGNRMGIPTVNGAILFDDRYLGNPLVYCGCVGIIPKNMHEKNPQPGDLIVVIGGRTGKDGLHGATFSSIELDSSSPVSAVQIGNAIEERKLMDAQLKARDLGLYNAVTDCGAGGFSSAIGELAKEIGAEVYLDNAPLKYPKMNAWEIWLSESQERMILSIPERNIERFRQICEIEDVEFAILGKFTNDKMLRVYHKGKLVLELDMDFLHNGLPKTKMMAIVRKRKSEEKNIEISNYSEVLKRLLAMPNIASKEKTIRGYDHEVQGGSVIKPLVGVENDGPSDAAIVRPILDSYEAVAIANGINPLYSDIDCYWMAASAIDEAIRNLICVGASLEKMALLDNFSWGSPKDKEKLGDIVEATRACHDFSLAYEVPFISGKDSLYNEYVFEGKNISIPGTLLISSIAIIEDCRKRISMYAKKQDSLLYLVGKTYDELGGSHFYRLYNVIGRNVPKVYAKKAKKHYEVISNIVSNQPTKERIILSMHDLSEGGLAVSLAEMAFAGMKGLEVNLDSVLVDEAIKNNPSKVLFSESNSRILVEVDSKKREDFEKKMKGCDFSLIGRFNNSKNLVVSYNNKILIEEDLKKLKQIWKNSLNW